MIWVGWRQQRTEAAIAAAILALLAAVLIPTGLQMASAYHHDGLSACTGVPSIDGSCDQAVGAFLTRFEQIGHFIDWLTLVPGIIGVLLAAPLLVALEHGTYRLDWTQSITRGRWIAGKLGLAIGAALVASLALTLLITWWRAPFVHLEGRMDNSVFDSEGTVVFGYTLFALGLATAVGVIWRRAVPALVVAFVGYFAARLFVDTWLRQRLVDPLTLTWKNSGREPTQLYHAWVLSEGAVGQAGLAGQAGQRLAVPSPGAKEAAAAGPAKFEAVYHPASHFWSLQLIETALFGGIALALLAFAAWWIHERIA
jgi:hypothetical protein